MTKREYLLRYSAIIKRLKRQPANFSDLEDALEYESELHGYDLMVSKRTFQRDLDDIRSLFHIDIQYDFSRKVYFIADEKEPELNDRILDAFDMYQALNVTDHLSNYIHFDSRKPMGTEYLSGILHAIKNRRVLELQYRKFLHAETEVKVLEPLALKEFRQRWYLVGKDLHDQFTKALALDRMETLEITQKKFKYPSDFNIHNYFQHCFGVIRPNDMKAQEIILRFEAFQGQYMKTLPLHESQTILKETDLELEMRLFLYPTFDFVMELMSYGDLVQVIRPQSLADELKQWHEQSARVYKNKQEVKKAK